VIEDHHILRMVMMQLLEKHVVDLADPCQADYELHSPFLYLLQLTTHLRTVDSGSSQLRLGEGGRIRTSGQELKRL
jgi:hypothetical protein